MQYRVVIKSFENGEVIETFDWSSNLRKEERVERGININLNHDKYYTEIEEKED